MKIVTKANYERKQDEIKNLYGNLKQMLNSVFDIIRDSRAFDFYGGIVGSGDTTFISSNQRKVIRFNNLPNQFRGFTVNNSPVSLQDLLKAVNKEKQREKDIKSVTAA